MTAHVVIPRSSRHPAWYSPLLLPVLPLLRSLVRGPATDGAMPTNVLMLLGAAAVLLAFAVPALIEHLGPSARKEADQLRPAWLASLLVAQVPLLLSPEFGDLALMFFGAACALLAALSFGVELQQGTLAALLSQPVPRQQWWTVKHGLLAGALATFWLTFLLSRLALGHPLDSTFAFGLLAIAAIAWGSTPAWTLRTRSLLTGLVLSMATPLSLASLGVLAWDLTDRYAPLSLIVGSSDENFRLVLLVVAPLYALAGHLVGRRLWHRLESCDPPAVASGILGFRPRGTSGSPVSIRHGRLSWLVRKELRLQTLTLLTLGVTALLAVAAVATRSIWFPHDYLVGGVLLMSTTGIALAGALPVAEERRLGTLECQRLLPFAPSIQWGIKTGMAAALATIAVGLGAVVALQDATPDSSQTLLVVLLATCIFALALLASSCAANGLRALLATVVAAATVTALVGFSATVFPRWSDQIAEEYREVALQDPAARRTEAGRLSNAAVEQMQQETAFPGASRKTIQLFLGSLGAATTLPTLLALVFASLNFRRPVTGPRRAYLQFGACLVISAACCASGLAGATSLSRQDAADRVLLDVRRTLDWEHTLTPTEHQLWERYRTGDFDWTIRVPMDPPKQRHLPDALLPLFSLPLPRGERADLIERGQIPEDWRAGLRADEAAAPPPQPPAQLRRYGLRWNPPGPEGTSAPPPGTLRRPGTRSTSPVEPPRP